MQDNPFADLIPNRPAQTAAPGYIPGRPKAPTAFQIEDQQMQRDAAARQQAQFDATQARMDRTEARVARNEDRALSKDAEGTESERTAAFLATRLAGSWADIQRITKETPDAASPELDTAILGGVVGRSTLNSSPRQRVEDAQLDVLDAALTLGTGAAYTKEQLEGYRQSYFPQYWDSPEAVADKKARLDRVLQAARVKAGRAAPLIDKALGASGAAMPVAKEVSALTVSNLADVATGLAGGKYEVTQDGGLTYNGEPVSASAEILNSQQYRDAYTAKFGEAPPLQVDVEGGSVAPDLTDRADAVVDPFVRGAADTLTLGAADEIAAAGKTIFGDGTMRQNLQAERAIDSYDERNNPVSRIAGQIAGGFALPTFGATGVRGLATVGAGYGGAYGFGSGDGSIADRLMSAGGGTVTGGVLGGAVGGLANRFVNPTGRAPVPPGGQPAVDLAQAAQAEGVRVSRPLLDAGSRDRMAYLESTVGGGPIREGLDATRQDIAGRVSNLAGQGRVQTNGMMGERIQGAYDRGVESSRRLARRAYDRADNAASGATALPTDAVAALDARISQLSANENSNRPLISYLNEIRSDLVDDAGNLLPKRIADFRDLRTDLRGQINTRNLSATRAEAIVSEVLDAARNDINRDLATSAPSALPLYARADQIWKARAEEIKQVGQKIIGNNDNRISGEQVMNRLQAMAGPKGDNARFDRVAARLTADEKADLVATWADTLGKKSAEEPFVPGLFVSQTRQYSDDALRNLFGSEGLQSIKNLRALSDAYKDTVGRLNNSRSGAVTNWRDFFKSLVAPGGAGVVGTIAGGLPGGAAGLALGAGINGAAALSRNLSAKALMNPDLSRWISVAPRLSTPASIQRHVARLVRIEAKNPSIAPEIGFIREAVSQSPSRAAAANNENRRRPEVPQQQGR